MRDFRAGLVREHRAHSDGFLFAGHESFFEDRWEARERAIVRDRLVTADVLIDAGACHGAYACLAAAMGVAVAAIEPNPENLAFLLSNIRANGFQRVEVFPVALARTAGVGELFGAGDISSLEAGWFSAPRDSARFVPINTLDNLFAARWPDARILVKLDAEGAELEVLRGAGAFLARRPRPDWLIETFPFRQGRYPEPNPDFAELFGLMLGLGYRCLHVESGREVSREMAETWAARPEAHDLGSSNYLFSAGALA